MSRANIYYTGSHERIENPSLALDVAKVFHSWVSWLRRHDSRSAFEPSMSRELSRNRFVFDPEDEA